MRSARCRGLIREYIKKLSGTMKNLEHRALRSFDRSSEETVFLRRFTLLQLILQLGLRMLLLGVRVQRCLQYCNRTECFQGRNWDRLSPLKQS